MFIIKNLKSLFFFFFFSLFLFPGFFLFLPSSSHVSLVASASSSAPKEWTYPSDKWSSDERKKTLSDLNKENLDWWLWIVAFGLRKLEFKSNDKDVTFYFDKLTAAFKTQVREQKKDHFDEDFDFTKIQGEAQKQLLQPYQKATINFVDGFSRAIRFHEVKYGNIFLNSIRLSLLKVRTFGFLQVYFPNHPFLGSSLRFWKFPNLKILENIEFWDDHIFDSFLRTFALITFYHLVPNYEKIILDKTINDVASPLLHGLQKASDSSLSHILVDSEKVDVSSLVTSKAQEASDLSLDQIKTLKKLKPLGLEKLESQVQTQIDSQQKDKKKKDKNLMIGLSVGGGVLALSTLGGFLYWFFKIKK